MYLFDGKTLDVTRAHLPTEPDAAVCLCCARTDLQVKVTIGKLIACVTWCSCCLHKIVPNPTCLSAPKRSTKRSSDDPFVFSENKSERNNPCKPYKDLAW